MHSFVRSHAMLCDAVRKAKGGQSSYSWYVFSAAAAAAIESTRN